MIIEVDNLSYSYPDSPDVLKGVNLNIRKGERVAVIGANGSGKTTLFLSLCGVLVPSEGRIRINGKEMNGKFSSDISYVFQHPDDQLFSPTVFEDVAFGPLNMGLSGAEVRKRADYALKRAGCSDLSDRIPHHLSGGEKRMVAIASVLSMKPEVILFDEPTSNLDSRNRRNLINTINESSETILLASHDFEFLLETCKRCILIEKGEILEDAPIRTIMGNKEKMNSYGMEKPHSLIPHSHLN